LVAVAPLALSRTLAEARLRRAVNASSDRMRGIWIGAVLGAIVWGCLLVFLLR
jgi:hypothetical protein